MEVIVHMYVTVDAHTKKIPTVFTEQHKPTNASSPRPKHEHAQHITHPSEDAEAMTRGRGAIFLNAMLPVRKQTVCHVTLRVGRPPPRGRVPPAAFPWGHAPLPVLRPRFSGCLGGGLCQREGPLRVLGGRGRL